MLLFDEGVLVSEEGPIQVLVEPLHDLLVLHVRDLLTCHSCLDVLLIQEVRDVF